MPRTARAVGAGGYYHVLNRGNGRMDKPGDFDAFVRIVAEGLERYRVDLLAWCLMSNHWHLVLRPGRAKELGRLMGWVCVTHVRRHHAHYHEDGGRMKRCRGPIYSLRQVGDNACPASSLLPRWLGTRHLSAITLYRLTGADTMFGVTAPLLAWTPDRIMSPAGIDGRHFSSIGESEKGISG